MSPYCLSRINKVSRVPEIPQHIVKLVHLVFNLQARGGVCANAFSLAATVEILAGCK